MELFENLGLSTQLTTTINRMGFTKPTQIQERSIPHIVTGKDVIGESETGSGKTLAFGCGIIEQVIPKAGLQALILTPTRELAEQVKNALRRFAYNKSLSISTIYGGVVIATPGRLLDHLERRTINTSKIKLLVMDEADRMLDMGFIEDVEKIIRACPSKRQTLFFSATISSRIKDMAGRYMKNPIKVMAGKHVDPSKLKQIYYDTPKNMKLSLLVHFLKKENSGLVMVFCNTRKNTDFVAKNLKANEIRAVAIHGGFSQNKRTRTIEMFDKAKVSVLVCTDVAARGLDIENVSHVYNYDLPKDPNDYVHRIGRTARAGESGKVINILCEYDYDNFSRIKDEYSTFSIEKVKRPYLEKAVFIRQDSPGRFGGRQPMHRRQSGRKFRRR